MTGADHKREAEDLFEMSTATPDALAIRHDHDRAICTSCARWIAKDKDRWLHTDTWRPQCGIADAARHQGGGVLL